MSGDLDGVVEQARIRGTPAGVLRGEFGSEDELVKFLEAGNSPSEIDGVGRKTADALMFWFEENHPDAHRRRRETDGSIYTEFETEEGSCGSLSADGKPVWGAYCPQGECGHLNLFEGSPDGFAGRPYRCIKCNWVSLMDAEVRGLEVPP